MHPQQIHSATLKAAAQQSMSTEPKPLEQQISEAYQSASQVETLARQLEARISKIDGAKRHLPQRNYGRPVDLAKIRSNLTLTSLIAQDSAELAHYCGIDPSIRPRIDEQREAKAMAAQSLQMRTEALRTKSQTAAAERQQRQNLAPWQRGYRSF